MTRLITGILLWSFMHFIPVIATDFRKRLVDSMGEKPYKIVFGLIVFGALFLIISGWKATVPSMVYTPVTWAGPVAFVLVLIGAVLFASPYPPNNFKRLFRHPQLVGGILWAIAHLLANGDSRSVTLFGGMGAWALIQIILTNRRNSTWERPVPVRFNYDIGVAIFSAGLFALFLFAHQYLFGVSLLDY
jgi:uncharacterized membrane protein